VVPQKITNSSYSSSDFTVAADKQISILLSNDADGTRKRREEKRREEKRREEKRREEKRREEKRREEKRREEKRREERGGAEETECVHIILTSYLGSLQVTIYATVTQNYTFVVNFTLQPLLIYNPTITMLPGSSLFAILFLS
jgi:hypothetical protein